VAALRKLRYGSVRPGFFRISVMGKPAANCGSDAKVAFVSPGALSGEGDKNPQV